MTHFDFFNVKARVVQRQTNRKRMTDNSPQRQLAPRQLAPKKSRPKTSRPTFRRQLAPN